jgi:hypothetical protein
MRVWPVRAGFVAGFVAGFAVLAPAAARAQPAAEPQHAHEGLYVRLELGAAYARLSTDIPANPPVNPAPGEAAFSGAAGAVNVAAGWTLRRNLVLYGKLNIARASNPQLDTEAGDGRWMGAATLRSFGAGAAYYVEPTNVYVAGTALASQVFISDGAHNEAGNSKLGFGLEGQVGKEWWASANVGLGLALQLVVATMANEDFATLTGGRWTALTGALLVTATYN